MTYDVQRWDIAHGPDNPSIIQHDAGNFVLAADTEAHEQAAVEAATFTNGLTRVQARKQAIRDAASEAALALMAMDGIEFTPEQHNSVIDAIHALLEEKP